MNVFFGISRLVLIAVSVLAGVLFGSTALSDLNPTRSSTVNAITAQYFISSLIFFWFSYRLIRNRVVPELKTTGKLIGYNILLLLGVGFGLHSFSTLFVTKDVVAFMLVLLGAIFCVLLFAVFLRHKEERLLVKTARFLTWFLVFTIIESVLCVPTMIFIITLIYP